MSLFRRSHGLRSRRTKSSGTGQQGQQDGIIYPGGALRRVLLLRAPPVRRTARTGGLHAGGAFSRCPAIRPCTQRSMNSEWMTALHIASGVCEKQERVREPSEDEQEKPWPSAWLCNPGRPRDGLPGACAVTGLGAAIHATVSSFLDPRKAPTWKRTSAWSIIGHHRHHGGTLLCTSQTSQDRRCLFCLPLYLRTGPKFAPPGAARLPGFIALHRFGLQQDRKHSFPFLESLRFRVFTFKVPEGHCSSLPCETCYSLKLQMKA